MTCTTSKSILEEMPPSAKLVYKTLNYEEQCTQKVLIEETRLSARTVRHALTRLEEAGLIEEHMCFQDARQRLYSLK